MRRALSQLDDGTEVILDQEQANVLNGVGVATAINANGYHLWGNNSCAYPATTDPKDRWFWVRRFLPGGATAWP